MDPTAGKFIRHLKEQNDQLKAVANQIIADIKKLQLADYDPKKELNAIPGRRVPFWLTGSQSFTTTQDGARGADIAMPVSQDGPFIWTHYPVVMWRPNTPTTATNFGMWRPIYTWPLPDQVLDTDIIDISWEVRDGGSQRQLQSESMPPLLSYPGMEHELPHECYFAPNSSVIFTPTYENIAFSSGGTATTGGLLKVALPGFRIVSM